MKTEANTFDFYLRQLQTKKFHPISHLPDFSSFYEIIHEYEGLTEEFNCYDEFYWFFIELDVTPADRLGLQQADEQTLEKFNEFDIYLKNTYKLKYIDMIDYQKGSLKIITST